MSASVLPASNPRPRATIRSYHIPMPLMGGVSAVQSLGFTLLIGFLFIIYSRIFDVKLYFLHIPGISYRVMGVLALLSGAAITAFKNPVGRRMLGFSACMFLAVPFSMWIRGSFRIVSEGWLMCVIIYVSMAGFILTLGQCRTAMKAVAYGVLVLTLITLKVGILVEGRLFWGQGGRFGNPNDLAQALLVGIPLWWFLVKSARSTAVKIFGCGAIGLTLWTIGKTGSRGALISIVLLGAVLFWRSSLSGKIKVLLAGVVLAMLAFLVLPSSIKSRYTTIVDEEEASSLNDTSMLTSAVSSSHNRKLLFFRSLKITLRHPLFGVGPGMFPVAEDGLSRELGLKKGSWLQTHNSFTQVSSEVGIPALIFYLALLIYCLRHTLRVHKLCSKKPELQSIADMALSLHFMVICFIVTACFASVAYTSFVPVLSGLTAAFLRASQTEIERITGAAPAPSATGYWPPLRAWRAPTPTA